MSRLREAIEDYLATEPGPAKSTYFRRFAMNDEASRNEYIVGLEADIRQVLKRLFGVHDFNAKSDPYNDPVSELYDWSTGRALADTDTVAALARQTCREAFQWRTTWMQLHA